ncbi:protein of unknown function [Agreia sp. COWG]|nr:protein of unknown function [Agreia sp. COWG]
MGTSDSAAEASSVNQRGQPSGSAGQAGSGDHPAGGCQFLGGFGHPGGGLNVTVAIVLDALDAGGANRGQC